MEKDRINALIAKYFNGTITANERAELMRSYDLQSDQDIEWMADSLNEPALVKQRMLLNIRQEIFPKKISRVNRVPYRFIYAAATLFIAATAGWLFLRQSPKPVASAPQTQTVKIKPGSDKATLTLATGKQIVLDHVEPGKIVENGGVRVLKTKEGQVVFTVIAQASAQPQLSTISTPKGGQYEVVLPDGTKVWLNSASSIRFPTAFTGRERRVSLEGEAYFEVAKVMIKVEGAAKDKGARMPFIVESKGQQVEVLGTHFNIMAYDNENSIKTTLLEGSVRVALSGDNPIISRRSNIVTLLPGQQAELNKSNRRMVVQEVSTKAAIAWKNGIFMFAHEDMRSILNKISRWYDVEVIYKNTSTDHRYSGNISRFDEVTEVLKTMEMTGTVHFEIKGRRIYVMD
jgi:transmembrane sensor